MNVKVEQLMVSRVMSMTPHQTVGHVRSVMSEHRVSCFPVVGPEGEPVGIVTATDLLDTHSDGTPISKVMSDRVFTVTPYDDPSTAARIMRNHHVHHLVVVHEKRIAGVISSFDLLRLVEDHRFTMKNPPTPSKASGARRKNELQS